ncbi:uncharacterized protein MCYG_07375 [Microsporum canis CBS 113480]|uniref:Uncharacterized protein n=1 Tax=Arthroderma otae (strain ATCC MYA-4605 / CBS 113480) TaxID=554155 RepID=C5FYF8_ARTOC|nr:uncharacterized protein MCYG_07375 [Microsporum canis CBS 113480]EEQ34556.1 predicted protein [Microsporum canis CBS 113480]
MDSIFISGQSNTEAIVLVKAITPSLFAVFLWPNGEELNAALLEISMRRRGSFDAEFDQLGYVMFYHVGCIGPGEFRGHGDYSKLTATMKDPPVESHLRFSCGQGGSLEVHLEI